MRAGSRLAHEQGGGRQGNTIRNGFEDWDHWQQPRNTKARRVLLHSRGQQKGMRTADGEVANHCEFKGIQLLPKKIGNSEGAELGKV
jgi:hypothetical protein